MSISFDKSGYITHRHLTPVTDVLGTSRETASELLVLITSYQYAKADSVLYKDSGEWAAPMIVRSDPRLILSTA